MAAWTSKFIHYFCNALDVSSRKKGVDLVEVSIFYKSEKTSGQTARLIKIAFLLYHGYYIVLKVWSVSRTASLALKELRGRE